jgi:RimJ/RimL family protein N-acetyltransferase
VGVPQEPSRRVSLAPLDGLVLRTPRLELRLGSRAELFELGRLAQEGIHPPAEMPFLVPWTDRSGEPGFVADVVAFHEAALRDWDAEEWSLHLLAFFDGKPIGTQSVRAVRFAQRREVDTGSWLGQAFQRQGLGTEMRAAVLELAFGALGAETATSGSVVGNESSRRVSEKLGYSVTGTSTIAPRGEPVQKHDLRIERAAWHPPFPVGIEGLQPCLPLFGLG